MKRHGHLWKRMISFYHLLRSAETARQGKRYRPAVSSFDFDLTPIACGADFFVQWDSSGRRPNRRVLRGGAFNNEADNCRSAIRNNRQPDNRNNNIGFRVSSTLRQA